MYIYLNRKPTTEETTNNETKEERKKRSNNTTQQREQPTNQPRTNQQSGFCALLRLHWSWVDLEPNGALRHRLLKAKVCAT